mmetsp:Transcript_39854/g.95662  ORF Transcript_39854/g.95662 Transcript_39854/m.95662 type:complete len:479 (-) Transcript_39854:602-2038(-)
MRRTLDTLALVLLNVLGVRRFFSPFSVEILELGKILPLGNQRLQGRRILADTIPASRFVTNAIVRIRHPLLGLQRHILHLENPHQPMLGCVRFCEPLGIRLHIRLDIMAVQLVQQRLRHHGSRLPTLIKPKLTASRIVVTTDIREHRIADARHVRGLGQIIAVAPSPDQHIIGQVSDSVPSPLLRSSEAPAQGRDVLVVPSVAIGDGGPVGDTCNLVPVIPPGHDAGILGGVVTEPLVGLEVVVDDGILSILHTVHEHNLWVGQTASIAVTMLHVLGNHRPRLVISEAGNAQGYSQLQNPPRSAAPELLQIFPLLGNQNRAEGPSNTPLDGSHTTRPLRSLRFLRLLLSEQSKHSLQSPVHHRTQHEPAQYGDNGSADDNQSRHLRAEMVGHQSVQNHEPRTRCAVEEAQHKSGEGQVARVVHVVKKRSVACRLVLGHGIHQWVPCLGVLHEKPANSAGDRAEIPGRPQQHHEAGEQH